MRRIEFRGFGFNWQTLLLLMVALSLASSILLTRPALDRSASSDTNVAAACTWTPWRHKFDDHGSFNWRIELEYDWRRSYGCGKVEIANLECDDWSIAMVMEQRMCRKGYDANHWNAWPEVRYHVCTIPIPICVTVQLKHWVSFVGHHGVVAEGPI